MTPCHRCLYWEELQYDSNRGVCRRYAPRPVTGDVRSFVTWPVTDHDASCGDGKPDAWRKETNG